MFLSFGREPIDETRHLEKHKDIQATENVQRLVRTYREREGLLRAGTSVVVGVSGGPDSLCLLHLLWTLRDELGIHVYAAHLNHLIRGAEADADAHFVAHLTDRWNVPSTIDARDVPALAREQKLAIEEAARRARYVFLARVARRVGATHIAVGHNANDQSETVLMHWLRGAGLAGLRGMLPATPFADLRLLQEPEGNREAEGPDLWLIRPLLETTRPDIERYCAEQNLIPRFDRSNLDTTLYRNKLRHELLPLLEREYKPGFGEILRRSARVIRDDYDLLCNIRDRAWGHVTRQVSDEAIVLDRPAWNALHPSLQRAILRQAVYHLRRSLRNVNFVHIEAAIQVAQRGIVGTKATLPAGVMLTLGYTTLTVADKDFAPVPDFPSLSPEQTGRTRLAVPGITPLSGQGEVEVELLARDELPPGWQNNPDPWCAYLDARVLEPEYSGSQGGKATSNPSALFVRSRQPGDQFCPLGLGERHKRVSDLLVNAKVPAQWRDQVPLLVRTDDTILWVCGCRMDERARVRPDTSRVVTVCLRLAKDTTAASQRLGTDECPKLR